MIESISSLTRYLCRCCGVLLMEHEIDDSGDELCAFCDAHGPRPTHTCEERKRCSP